MPMEISGEIKEHYRPAGTLVDNSFHYSYETPKQPLLRQEGKMKAGLHHLSSTADERIWWKGLGANLALQVNKGNGIHNPL